MSKIAVAIDMSNRYCLLILQYIISLIHIRTKYIFSCIMNYKVLIYNSCNYRARGIHTEGMHVCLSLCECSLFTKLSLRKFYFSDRFF